MDEDCVWGEDLDLGFWFPLGSTAVEIEELPGADLHLRNNFIIFFAQDQISSPTNYSLAKLYGIHWMGNIVVVKRARGVPRQIIQMGGGEHHLVEVVVAM